MIITSTNQIKAHTNINKNISFDSLRPFVQRVEAEEVVSVIGKDLYDIIEANDGLTAEQIQLKILLEPMIANFAMYWAMPQLNTSVSDLGIMSHSSTDGSASSSEMWKFNDLRVSYFMAGNTAREQVYKYLQENEGSFAEWVGSPQYTVYNQYFLRTNNDLSEIIGKGENVNTFLSLRPFMEFCELKYIHPILTEAYSEELKTKRNENDLSQNEEKILKCVKNVMGWALLFEACTGIRFMLVDGTMVTSIPGESSRVYQPVGKDELNMLKEDCRQKIGLYQAKLKELYELLILQLQSVSYGIIPPENRGKKSFRL